MPGMIDPMDALVQLQTALEMRAVALQPGQVHRDIMVIADQPNGRPRYTYAKVKKGKVGSIALFVHIDPIESIPCFQVGWATAEVARGKGLASQATAKGIDELRNGLKGYGIGKFYIEAIVGSSNLPSNRIAKKLLSDSPVSCTDEFSGESALQYLRLIE